MIRKEVFLLVVVSLCLLLVNFIGILTLIEIKSDSRWAPVIVFGIWIFLTQIQILGMVAALLPHSLHSSFAYPFAMVLAIYAEILPFRVAFETVSGIRLNELSLVMLSGFFASWTYFLIYRAVRGRRLVRADEPLEVRIETKHRFSILDILTLTSVVAILSTALRFNYVDRDLPTVLFSALGFGILTILFAPMNFLLSGDRRQKRLGILLMVLVLILVPFILISLMPNVWGRPDEDWPFLYCLTFGVEGAWLIGLRCIKLLNYRWVSGKLHFRGKF